MDPGVGGEEMGAEGSGEGVGSVIMYYLEEDSYLECFSFLFFSFLFKPISEYGVRGAPTLLYVLFACLLD